MIQAKRQDPAGYINASYHHPLNQIIEFGSLVKQPEHAPTEICVEIACLMSFGFGYEVSEELIVYRFARIDERSHDYAWNHATFEWCLRHKDRFIPEDVLVLLGYIRHIFDETNDLGFLRRGYSRMLREAHAHNDEMLARLEAAAQLREVEERKREPYADDALGFAFSQQGHEISFEQLFTVDALKSEGEAMRHCVGSYASRCGQGDSAIVSLQRDGRRALTIEVHRANREVIQVRGKYNRSPSGVENSWLVRWAEAVGVVL
ncbi:MAG: hypothetical protein GVY36_01910 [Verrucomicrobia bacterium]|jgi:hypothetical protein|nr:hypothetical protein [Verrucomicrobiota bacterium]